MAESEEELNSLLMKVKEESEKSSLKLNVQNNNNNKIMASDPITSWQIGEKCEEVTNFIYMGSKITADGDFSHKYFKIFWWLFGQFSG